MEEEWSCDKRKYKTRCAKAALLQSGLFPSAAQVLGCGSQVKQEVSSLLPQPTALALTLFYFHHLGYLLHYHSPCAPALFLPSQAPAQVPIVSTAGPMAVFDPVQKRAEFVLVTDSALVPDLPCALLKYQASSQY